VGLLRLNGRVPATFRPELYTVLASRFCTMKRCFLEGPVLSLLTFSNPQSLSLPPPSPPPTKSCLVSSPPPELAEHACTPFFSVNYVLCNVRVLCVYYTCICDRC
jgi:hypothetical protein